MRIFARAEVVSVTEDRYGLRASVHLDFARFMSEPTEGIVVSITIKPEDRDQFKPGNVFGLHIEPWVGGLSSGDARVPTNVVASSEEFRSWRDKPFQV